MSKINLLYILLILNVCSLLHANEVEYLESEKSLVELLKFWKTPELKVRYKFNKFSAIIPEELYFIIDGFKTKSILLNRLILHGPPGNGKSSLANQIAKELDAQFIEISGPSIVTKFQGSGSETIKKSFETALEYLKYNKNVVVFIDEIDSIAPNFEGDDRFHDHKAALQALWLWLDKVKAIPGIFIITATNKFEKLDKAFVSRFDGNIVELKNPEKQARKEIIKFYVNEFNKQISKQVVLSSYLIDSLADQTNGLNTRTIEGIVRLIVQKASSTKAAIKMTLINSIVSRQKAFLKAQNKDDKNKKDLISKIKSNLTVMNVSLSVFCSCLFLYDRYVKKLSETKFWNPIYGFEKWLGLKGVVDTLKNNPEDIAKLSNAFTLQFFIVIGYKYYQMALKKIGYLKKS
ncbi:MAG: AAA family ATPase [Candidatus Babeliales bacterium]|nr:AAA family ATPase [Candidatus Babeliales bacterium]